MLIGLLLNTVQTAMNLASEIFKADSKAKSGDIFGAEGIYRELFQHFRDNEVFQDKYAELMMMKGNYAEVISNFGKVPRKEMEARVRKARECLSVVVSNDTRLIASLIGVSPYSRPVLRAYIQVCLIDEKFEEAEKAVRRARAMFPGPSEFVQQEMQLQFLRGRFPGGIKMLGDMGHERMARIFHSILSSYEKIKQSHGSSASSHASLRRLLREISLAEVEDNFSPSIFNTLKQNVVFDFCKTGVESGARGLTERALSLHMKRKSDDTMYFYIMALILDGNLAKAEEKYESHKFRNPALKNYVFRRLKMAKAEERARNERQEGESRRRQRRHGGYHGGEPRNRGDFLGYYGALGVSKDAKANEIKKAYSKIVVKNKGKKKTKKEEEKWNELFKKINKARGILLDPKKREMYDSGIDPDNPQPQFGGFDDGDIFQEFFKSFGGFDFSGGRRRGSSTHFYFG